ncbi:TPA: retron Ec48 family effector membrane protein [Photobacterium damselae]
MNLQNAIFKIIKCVFCVFILVTLITIISVIFTGFDKKYFYLDFCLNNTCFKNAKEFYSNIIDFFFVSMQIISSVATALGIVVAALTFKNTSETNALNCHISHFKIFTDYLVLELNKREMIKISSINTFDWYNLIFNNSINGSISVSDDYIEALKYINEEIKATNNKATKSSNGPFRHHEHQRRMKLAFIKLGIEIEQYPKNDYWSIENEIIMLIDTVNQAFCQKKAVSPLEKRLYYKK